MTRAGRVDSSGLVLHDTPIDSAEFDEVGGRLVFMIDLCAWMQPGHIAGQPDLTPGRLVFEGVHRLRLDPSSEVLSSAWWVGRSGKFLTKESSGIGALRIVFEAGPESGVPRPDTYVLDFCHEAAYFEPALAPPAQA